MSRYIDADLIKKKLQDTQINSATVFINTVLIGLLNDAPTEDVVPVVRCIDCKHLMFSDCYGECSKGYMGIVSPNDYCSYGERKEE